MVWEAFNTWAEDDPLNRLTQTATRSTWTAMTRGDIETALGEDKGAGWIDLAWTYQFRLRMTQLEAGDADSRTYAVALGADNVVGAVTPDPVTLLYLFVKEDAADDTEYTMMIMIKRPGLNVTDTSSVMAVGTDYYITMVRSNFGNTITVTIRTGSHVGPVVDTISATHVDFDDTFRYLKCPIKRDYVTDPGDWSTGYVEFLDLAPAPPTVGGMGAKPPIMELLLAGVLD